MYRPTGYFRAVPAQARHKMRVVPYSPSCWDPRHGTTLVFVSCWHSPKYFVLCRALGRDKWSCRSPFENGTAQIPARSYRAGTVQNISCCAMLWVVPNDRAAARPKIARPKSPFFSLFSLPPAFFSFPPLSWLPFMWWTWSRALICALTICFLN